MTIPSECSHQWEPCIDLSTGREIHGIGCLTCDTFRPWNQDENQALEDAQLQVAPLECTCYSEPMDGGGLHLVQCPKCANGR